MFDNYDPTKTPAEQEQSTKQADGLIRVKGKYYDKKTLKERILTVINNVKSADKYSIAVFKLSMINHFMGVAQGLCGLFTLTLWEPRWTYKASLKLAVAIADENTERERVAELNEQDSERDSKVNAKPKDIDEWLKRFQEGQ